MLIDKRELQEALKLIDDKLHLMHDEVKNNYWLMSIDAVTNKDKWLQIDYVTLSKDYLHRVRYAAAYLFDKWHAFVNSNYRSEKQARKNLEAFYDNFIE